MGRTLEEAYERFDLTGEKLNEFAEVVRNHFENAYQRDFPEGDPREDEEN